MAVHPVQWTICRWDRRIEAVVRVNDADHDGEAVHCANAGKVQTDADGEIPGRVKGRKCTGFVHVDDGDTSELIVLNDLLRTDVKRSNVTHPAGRPRVHSASQGCGRITRITWTTRPRNNECLPSSPIRGRVVQVIQRSEEHTSELQSHSDLVCRLLLEKKKKKQPAVQNTKAR